MSAARRVCLGVVTGAHGVRGDVRVRPFTAEPAAIGDYGALEDASGARRFEVRHVHASAKGVTLRLAGIEDRDAADALRGTELWVDRARLPATADDEWYVDDLKDLLVIDETGVEVGRVRTVADYGAGDVVEIVTADGKDLVLPFTREQFPEVAPAAGRIVMAAPSFLETGER